VLGSTPLVGSDTGSGGHGGFVGCYGVHLVIVFRMVLSSSRLLLSCRLYIGLLGVFRVS